MIRGRIVKCAVERLCLDLRPVRGVTEQVADGGPEETRSGHSRWLPSISKFADFRRTASAKSS
jgi:hypothetical protein